MDNPSVPEISIHAGDRTKISGPALDLIARAKTMTLATALGDVPWAAPVYYAYWKRAFWFFSDPESRHIREALASGRAAAAIYTESSSWREIQGLQMSGSVGSPDGSRERAGAFGAYLEKFPFVEDFFNPAAPPALDLLLRRFGVRLYCFRADLVYYLDNAIRFGFRQEVDL